jgi:hypothetical protein
MLEPLKHRALAREVEFTTKSTEKRHYGTEASAVKKNLPATLE